jgi:hypothetical protein
MTTDKKTEEWFAARWRLELQTRVANAIDGKSLTEASKAVVELFSAIDLAREERETTTAAGEMTDGNRMLLIQDYLVCHLLIKTSEHPAPSNWWNDGGRECSR